MQQQLWRDKFTTVNLRPSFMLKQNSHRPIILSKVPLHAIATISNSRHHSLHAMTVLDSVSRPTSAGMASNLRVGVPERSSTPINGRAVQTSSSFTVPRRHPAVLQLESETFTDTATQELAIVSAGGDALQNILCIARYKTMCFVYLLVSIVNILTWSFKLHCLASGCRVSQHET